MATSVFISSGNPYPPPYYTKYYVKKDLNTQVGPNFDTYDQARAWAEANGYCVIANSSGWNIGGNPPCPVSRGISITASPSDIPGYPAIDGWVRVSVRLLGGGSFRILADGVEVKRDGPYNNTDLTLDYNIKMTAGPHNVCAEVI